MSDTKNSERIVFIDVLKSIACLCVLTGHVINGMLKDGMEVSALLRAVNTYVYLFHVPCFFFASGYLYANRRVKTWPEYLHFAGKKLIVLGLPYFVCSIAYILFSSFLSADMHTAYSFEAIRGLCVSPVAQYWYLYALFEMFLLVPALELVLRGAGRGWLLLLFIACALGVQTNVPCVKYIVSYICYFYMGSYCNRTGIAEKKRMPLENGGRLLFLSGVGSGAVYAVYQLAAAGLNLAPAAQALKAAVGLLLVLSIVGISLGIAVADNLACRFLVWLSQYSLYVYLFHTWFTGTLRILLRRMGVTDSWIQTVCGIGIGLAGSLIAAAVIRKVPFFRFWFEPFAKVKKTARDSGTARKK